MSDTGTRDLSARIMWHELMLALIVMMQAIDLYWSSGDGVSAVLAYGFGIIAAFLWIRVLGLYIGPSVKRIVGQEVN